MKKQKNIIIIWMDILNRGRGNEMNEAQVKRLFKIADFLGIKYNEKEMNIFDFQDMLYEKMQEWEEENGKEFPL